MAEMTVSGLDELAFSMKEIAELPDEVVDDMLLAGADVVARAQKQKVLAYGIYDGSSPVHVADKIRVGKIKEKNGVRVVHVTPTGSRRRGKTKQTVTRNAEILFINEYGKKGQRPRTAIRDANEESAAATTAAQMAVYDKFLESKNL